MIAHLSKNYSLSPKPGPYTGPPLSSARVLPKLGRTPSHLKKSLETTPAFSRGDLCMVSGDARVPPGAGWTRAPDAKRPAVSVPAARPFFFDLL